MRTESRHRPRSPAIVVGIDGSRRAIDAAKWAVAEAVDRDLPVRLVYAIEPRESVGNTSTHDTTVTDLAAAESAVRQAAAALGDVEQPVQVEVDIRQERAIDALVTASQSAAMVCVGALGVNHATGNRVGSTVPGLTARAHCPVAVIRPERVHRLEPGWVVTAFEHSPEGAAVLEHALEEARLREAPLRVLTTWRPGSPGGHADAASERTRYATADLERSLACYRQRYPGLDIRAVAVTGSAKTYLSRHAESIQLLVLGQQASGELAAFAGPRFAAELEGPTFSVLICGRCGAL